MALPILDHLFGRIADKRKFIKDETDEPLGLYYLFARLAGDSKLLQDATDEPLSEVLEHHDKAADHHAWTAREGSRVPAGPLRQAWRLILERDENGISLSVMSREDMIREIQERFRQTGQSFNEFQRRYWAAREALKLGRGGITLVSHALRMSPNTIKRGIQEIVTGQAELYLQANSRIRKPGGGRKSK